MYNVEQFAEQLKLQRKIIYIQLNVSNVQLLLFNGRKTTIKFSRNFLTIHCSSGCSRLYRPIILRSAFEKIHSHVHYVHFRIVLLATFRFE